MYGRIRGYQFGATSAFYHYYEGIDSYYVDGICLTHGGAGRRQHIWTFAAGVTEVSSSYPTSDCPCDTGNYNCVPAFVGHNYFCESGFHSSRSFQFVLFPNDVLGMVRTVHRLAHAVSSTTLHGLQEPPQCNN